MKGITQRIDGGAGPDSLRIGETVKIHESPDMPPQTHPKPAQGEAMRWPDTSPDWNKPAPEARTRKTESPFGMDKLSALARKFFGMQGAETVLAPEALKTLNEDMDMDMNKVQEEAASKPFVESKISDVRRELAEQFGKQNTALAEHFGKVDTALSNIREKIARDSVKQTRWLVGTLFTLVIAILAAVKWFV